MERQINYPKCYWCGEVIAMAVYDPGRLMLYGDAFSYWKYDNEHYCDGTIQCLTSMQLESIEHELQYED